MLTEHISQEASFHYNRLSL